MAAVFVGLKLRLLLSGLRSSGNRRVFFVLGALFGLAVGLGGFAAVAASGRADDDRIITLLFGVITVGWIVLPLFAFGVDELLDPSRLALFPLSGPQLIRGLLASSAVGVPPVATLIALYGAFPGYGHTPLAGLVVAAAIVAELLLCVLLSRAITTSLSGLLRSRRGRDATAIVLALAGGMFGLIGPLVTAIGRNLDSTAGRAVVSVARYSPFGAAGVAVSAAGSGRYVVAVGQLALSAGYIGVALLSWQRGLQKALTSVEQTGRKLVSDHAADLRPRWTRPLLPNTAVGAIAAKDLRYMWRDPMRRTALLATVGPASVTLFSAFASGGRNPRSVLFAMVTATMLSVVAINQFGLDGAAYWMNVVAGNDPHRDLVGKNLAVAVVAIPATAVVATITATITGGWAYIPLAVLGGVAGCGGALCVANIVSVRSPAPQPENMTNAWAGRGGGQSMAAGLTQMAALVLVAIILAPLGIFIAFSALRWTPGLFIAGPLSVGYGLTLWRLGLRSSVRWLWWREAELLQAVRPRQAA
jgi:ABC-2 type transport system permease protein